MGEAMRIKLLITGIVIATAFVTYLVLYLLGRKWKKELGLE